MSEIDKFFEGLPSEDKPHTFGQEKEPQSSLEKEEKTPEEGETPGDKDERKLNRRERRAQARSDRKDQMLIEMNNKIIDLVSKNSSDRKSSDEVPPEWITLYGDTPQARKAWEVNQTWINRAKEEAKAEALSEIEEQQQAAIEEQQKYENDIDEALESLEDEHDVDLTSNTPAARKARREFLELIEELSPKDDDGAITGYADFDKTFEIYQKSRQSSNTGTDKKKELAARSMNKGLGNASTEVKEGPMTWETAKHAIRRLTN